MCRALSYVVPAHRTSSNPLKTHDIRESEVCTALSYKFGVVQAHRMSSNPLKQHDLRQSKMCRVLSHEFGVVQAQRTSSNPSKHMIADRARCVELCHISSGWFKHNEPPQNA